MKQLKIAITGQGRSGRGFHGGYILPAPDAYKGGRYADSFPVIPVKTAGAAEGPAKQERKRFVKGRPS
jgi:hypothetical protein